MWQEIFSFFSSQGAPFRKPNSKGSEGLLLIAVPITAIENPQAQGEALVLRFGVAASAVVGKSFSSEIGARVLSETHGFLQALELKPTAEELAESGLLDGYANLSPELRRYMNEVGAFLPNDWDDEPMQPPAQKSYPQDPEYPAPPPPGEFVGLTEEQKAQAAEAMKTVEEALKNPMETKD